MGYASYSDSIVTIGCDLEHIAAHSSKPTELDIGAAQAVIAEANRALGLITDILEVATDPNLDLAVEVVLLRATLKEGEKQQRDNLARMASLSRDVAERTRETLYWRDEYLTLMRRIWEPGRARRPISAHRFRSSRFC
jgi:hypothetical protein